MFMFQFSTVILKKYHFLFWSLIYSDFNSNVFLLIYVDQIAITKETIYTIPNNIKKNEISNIDKIRKNMKTKVSHFFQMFKYLIYQDWSPGGLRCCWIRNHAYQRKQKNSIISIIFLIHIGVSQKAQRLNGDIGSGHRKWISLNQKK